MQTVTQLRSQPEGITNRKSRLNFNVRPRSLKDASSNASVFSSMTQVQDPHTKPHPLLYSHTNGSDSSINSATYNLVKMNTNTSLTSELLAQPQFKVQLTYNKKEIELIRYTWNKMLLDEPIEQKSDLPGGFPNDNALDIPVNNGSRISNRSASSTVASSLFCRQFYSNLILMDPNLERLFPLIKHQAVSFAGVMSLAISQLENLSNLDDYLINLGKRHSRILCIEPPNFELMGEALIQTFHERFGSRFDLELEILWIKLYLFLANLILQFGIDPVLKLADDKDMHTYNHNYTFEDRRSSVMTLATNTTNSIALTSMDAMSVTTGHTSINTMLGGSGTGMITMSNPKKFKERDNSDVASIRKTTVKRKRDCVIM